MSTLVSIKTYTPNSIFCQSQLRPLSAANIKHAYDLWICARAVPVLRAMRIRASVTAYAPGGSGFHAVAANTIVGRGP